MKSAKLFVCVGLTMFFAALAVPASSKIFNPETFTLKNGLQVVVIPNHRVPVVTHSMYYRVGAIDEPPGKSGLAHFFEHLMFKGTKTLKPGQFSAIVARNGGRENAFTTHDYTGYYQTVAADRLERMMRIEADRMTNLVLSKEDIEPERQVVLEERRSRVENNPNAQLRESVGAALYMNYPYRIPIIGWGHEIRALSQQDIVDFYKRWYAPNNAILILSGDVTAAKVRPMVEKYYGVIPARKLPPRPEWREPPQSAERRVVLKHKQVRHPAWSQRYLAPSYRVGDRKDAYALQILSEILGGGSTSRLYRALAVEQKIAAAAGAWYDPDARGPGTFSLYASPRPGTKVEDVASAVKSEIQRLLKDGVTEKEVREAVTRLQDAAVFARDSINGPAQIFGGALAIGLEVEDVESWPDRIGAVTAEAVNRVARSVLGSVKPVTAVLLPDETI